MAPLLEVQWAPFFISTLYTYTSSTKTQGHKSWAKDTVCANPIHPITFHKVVVCTAAAYHSDQWGSHLSDSVPGVPISRASATETVPPHSVRLTKHRVGERERGGRRMESKKRTWWPFLTHGKGRPFYPTVSKIDLPIPQDLSYNSWQICLVIVREQLRRNIIQRKIQALKFIGSNGL